jgi:pimeloyl-ACP methyl ester carboxylesterase
MSPVGPLLPIQHVRCEVGSLSVTGQLVLDTRLSHLDPLRISIEAVRLVGPSRRIKQVSPGSPLGRRADLICSTQVLRLRGALGANRDGIATGSIDGLVLTSTVTRPGSAFARAFPEFARDYPDGVMRMALSEIRVPTLIVSHSEDACEYTPAADAPALAKRLTQAAKVEIALLSGGDPPRSVPCEAYAAHGYYGIETQAVDRIADFITANSKRGP